MQAEGKHGREGASGCRGGDMLPDPLFWAGSRVGVPTLAPAVPGVCHPSRPLPQLRPCSAPSSARGSSRPQQCRTWLLPQVQPATALWRCCQHHGGLAPRGSMSSLLGSAHRSLRALHRPGLSHCTSVAVLMWAAVPRQGHVPGGRGDGGWSTAVSLAECCYSHANC